MGGRTTRSRVFIPILETSVNRPNFQLNAYLGLLNGSRNEKYRDIVFSELKQLVEDNPASLGSFLALDQVSQATKMQSSMETPFEKAAQMASKDDDAMDKLRQVMQSQLKVNDLAGAYRTWRRVVPSDRSYVGTEFLVALMKAKHYSGVMQYIEQVPSEEDKANAIFSAIRLAYNGRIHDDIHSWVKTLTQGIDCTHISQARNCH